MAKTIAEINEKIRNGQADWEEATNLKALIYMYPASLSFLLDHGRVNMSS